MEKDKSNKKIHLMSQGAIEAVKEGLEQIKNSQCIPDEEASRQIEEWLNE